MIKIKNKLSTEMEETKKLIEEAKGNGKNSCKLPFPVSPATVNWIRSSLACRVCITFNLSDGSETILVRW